jgi:hypothetical protein
MRKPSELPREDCVVPREMSVSSSRAFCAGCGRDTASRQPPDLGSPLSRISSVSNMSTLSDEYHSSPGDALSWTDAATVRNSVPASRRTAPRCSPLELGSAKITPQS